MEENKEKFDFEWDDGNKESEGSKDTSNTPEKENKTENSNASVQEIITGDPNENLVVFIGPQQTGKTVALMRLAHYLAENEVTSIDVNRTYRSDNRYQESVSNFLKDLHNPDFNPRRTGRVDFLLLDVFKEGEVYCQFLEATGEAFYKSRDPYSLSFPPYLTKILNNGKINKVFVFFFTEDMLRYEDPRAYSKRLARLVRKLDRKRDDVIIVFNKADELYGLFSDDRPNIRAFKNKLYRNTDYNDFFIALKDKGLPVKFVPFTSGDFEDVPGKKDVKRWIHSKDIYPRSLWRVIDRCFKSYSWWRF